MALVLMSSAAPPLLTSSSKPSSTTCTSHFLASLTNLLFFDTSAVAWRETPWHYLCAVNQYLLLTQIYYAVWIGKYVHGSPKPCLPLVLMRAMTFLSMLLTTLPPNDTIFLVRSYFEPSVLPSTNFMPDSGLLPLSPELTTEDSAALTAAASENAFSLFTYLYLALQINYTYTYSWINIYNWTWINKSQNTASENAHLPHEVQMAGNNKWDRMYWHQKGFSEAWPNLVQLKPIKNGSIESDEWHVRK